jgi:hypothetical protein
MTKHPGFSLALFVGRCMPGDPNHVCSTGGDRVPGVAPACGGVEKVDELYRTAARQCRMSRAKSMVGMGFEPADAVMNEGI